MSSDENVVWFENLGMGDVDRVGGKNASLGEMTQHLAAAGVNVPGGFATTANAYREFLSHEGLADRINAQLGALDVDDVTELARVGKAIREDVIAAPFPPDRLEIGLDAIGAGAVPSVPLVELRL